MSEPRKLAGWVLACLLFGMASLALVFGDVDSFKELREQGLKRWLVGR